MNNNNIPQGWEEVPQISPDEALELPDGWEEVDEYTPWNEQEISHAKLNPTTEQYLQDNKSFLERVSDGAVDTVKTLGSAVQDGLNIITPIGEVDFMGEAYIGDKIRKDAANLIGIDTSEDDLTIQGYNAINKLAKTHINWNEPTQKDIDTYESNLANVVIDNLGYDDLQKDEAGKYWVVKDDKEIELNKDTFKEIVSDIYGDKMEIAAAMIGAKKGADLVPDALGKKANIVGSLIGSGVGAFTGNLVDQLDSIIETGEKLNTTQRLNEANKALALDMAGNVGGEVLAKTAGTIIDNTPGILKNTKDTLTYNKPGSKDTKANQFIDKHIDINSPENKASADIAKDLGGVSDQRLTQMASDQDVQKSASDMFTNDKDMTQTVLDDQQTLTQNLYNELGVTQKKNSDIGIVDEQISGIIDNQAKGLSKAYSDVYATTKKDIVDIAGDEIIDTVPTSVKTIQEQINKLGILENVEKQKIDVTQVDEFDKDFHTLATKVNNLFLDENGDAVKGYSISKIMDAQKYLNQYASKHSMKMVSEQVKAIADIRKSLYDDLENYVSKKLDKKNAKIVKEKWKNVNQDYSSWKKDLSNSKVLDSIVKDENTIKSLSSDMIKQGTIDKEYLEMFGNIAHHIKKTTPQKMDEFHDTMVNALLQPFTVNQKINSATKNFLAFDDYANMYEKLPRKALNKIFGQTSRGEKILQTLDGFKTLAKDEAYLQKAIYHNQSPLNPAAQQAVETKRTFLFGLKYFITRTVVDTVAENFIPSVAFHSLVTDLAKKKRYNPTDFNKIVNKVKHQATNTTFDKELIENLKKAKQSHQTFEKESKQTIDNSFKDTKKLNDTQQKELFEKLYTKANIDHELYKFGRNFSKFQGKPVEAIEYLLKTKNGQVRGAFSHSELGEIDLVWGNDNYGLKHILEQRTEQWGETKAKAFIKRLPEIVQDSIVYKHSEQEAVLINPKSTAIIELKYDEYDKHWLLTALRDSKNKKRLKDIEK